MLSYFVIQKNFNMKNFKIDLLIGYNQIQLRTRTYSEKLTQWTEKHLEQGAILHKNYLVFDPIADGTFGASINIYETEHFVMDKNAKRCILTSIENIKKNPIILSSMESIELKIDNSRKKYSVYFEVCEAEEVYYNITLTPYLSGMYSKFIIDDEWGGIKDSLLILG